eukprot:gene26532-32065_t
MFKNFQNDETWYTITSEFPLEAVFGYSADNIGDFNGDNIPDFIISAPHANALNRTKSGCVYLLYGNSDRLAMSDLDLASLTPLQGFRIIGSTGSLLGSNARGIGDWNGDGFNDIIVTAPGKSKQGRNNGGMAYIILGKLGGYEFVDLAKHKSPTYGLKIYGSAKGSMLGAGGHGADGIGDFNADGFDDVVIGEHGKNDYTGEAVILFGSASTSDLDLALPLGERGFVIKGNQAFSICGDRVFGVGGFRWDSAPAAEGKGYQRRGDVLVVCGAKVMYLYGGPGRAKDRLVSDIVYVEEACFRLYFIVYCVLAIAEEGSNIFGTFPSLVLTAPCPSTPSETCLFLGDDAKARVYVVRSGGKLEAGEDGVDVRRLRDRGSILKGPEDSPGSLTVLSSSSASPTVLLHSPSTNDYYGVTYVTRDPAADLRNVTVHDKQNLKEQGMSVVLWPPNIGSVKTHLLPLGTGSADVLLIGTSLVDGQQETATATAKTKDLSDLAQGRGRAYILIAGFQHRTRIDLGNAHHNRDVDDSLGEASSSNGDIHSGSAHGDSMREL